MKSLPRMNSYQILANTPHGTIQYTCKSRLTEVKDLIQYVDKNTYDALCKQGCPNYNKKWSCPPYAPDFTSFTTPFQYINIILLLANMEEFCYIKQNYLKIKAANSVLKSRIDKALRCCMNEDEFYISTGSCRLCRSCKKKMDGSCAHPKERTYSFEALGINVSAMAKSLFKTELLWYKKNELPKYTCVVGGLLTNCNSLNEKVVKKLVQLR